MLFNVENDAGDQLSGYLVTDSFGGKGQIRISSGGQQIAIVDALYPIPALVAAGRHETGHCGFVINEAIIPGLRTMSDLEIREAETGLLIYRRASETGFVAERVVRLETHMVGLSRVDRAMSPLFCYAYRNAHQAGLESMRQIFHLLHAQSLYLAGRFFFRSFENYIEQQHCKLVCMIHDPFEELAERLLLLRHAARRGRLELRDKLSFAAAMEFAAELPLDSDRKIRAAFGRLHTDAAQSLQNPLVRQLTLTNPQDMLHGGAIASALTALSTCAIVGLRSESEAFALALSALAGSGREFIPIVPRCNAAMALAERLRKVSAVHNLLELDLALYERVSQAYRQAAVGLSIPAQSRYFSVP